MQHSDIVRNHFDFKYKDYDSLIRKLAPKYEEMHRLTIESVLSNSEEPRILDLGIGTGETALRLLDKFPKARIDGYDISSKMIAHGKERLKDYSEQVVFNQIDIKDLDLNKKYDVCVGALSIHHLDPREKQELFNKVFESLEDGGVFVIADIVKFNSKAETVNKEKEWLEFLKTNFSQEEANYWFENYKEEDLPDSVRDQVEWLKKSGFSSVNIIWEHINFAVIQAIK